MAVGGVRGGGRGPRGPSGGARAGGKGPVGGKSQGPIDKTASLVGPSGAAGSAEAAASSQAASTQAPSAPLTPEAAATASMVAKAKEVAGQLRSGEISYREALRKLNRHILTKRGFMKNGRPIESLERFVTDQTETNPDLSKLVKGILERG
jgi:hypothetical protein